MFTVPNTVNEIHHYFGGVVEAFNNNQVIADIVGAWLCKGDNIVYLRQLEIDEKGNPTYNPIDYTFKSKTITVHRRYFKVRNKRGEDVTDMFLTFVEPFMGADMSLYPR